MYWLAAILALVLSIYFFIVNPVFSKRNNEIKINIKQDALKKHVNFLCQSNPPRTFENTESLNKVADYIALNFVNCGFDTARQRYSDGTYDFQNIICQYLPEKEERVVLGAHYDVCGPFQGADDNASGVAGLLEIARLFSVEKPELEFGIDFVAYSTEEPPYFRSNAMGSAVHADFLKEEKVKVKLMVVLEMIGYFNEKPNSQQYPINALKNFYPTTADFIAIVGRTKEFSQVRNFKKNMIKSSDIKVESINTPVIFEGIDFSDHRNYWSRDMNAIMITNTSFFRNSNYHTEFDTPETLDFEKMTEVVKGCYYALVNLK